MCQRDLDHFTPKASPHSRNVWVLTIMFLVQWALLQAGQTKPKLGSNFQLFQQKRTQLRLCRREMDNFTPKASPQGKGCLGINNRGLGPMGSGLGWSGHAPNGVNFSTFKNNYFCYHPNILTLRGCFWCKMMLIPPTQPELDPLLLKKLKI